MGLWPQRDHITQETSNDELPHIEEGDATARRNVEGAGESSVQAAADAQGKTSSEAMRQALVEWMSRVQQAA